MTIKIVITDEDFENACRYEFASWPRLKAKARELAIDRMIACNRKLSDEFIENQHTLKGLPIDEYLKKSDKFDKLMKEFDDLMDLRYPKEG